MTPRSIRRAAERKANKQARKTGQPLASATIIRTEAARADQNQPQQNPPAQLRSSKILSGQYPPSEIQFGENQSDDNLNLENLLPSTHAPEPTPVPIPPAAAVNAYLSAITSTLTGNATLLPTADAAHYDQLIRDYQDQHQPAGPQESNLVQILALTAWRMRRTTGLEMTIFAKGRIEFAEQFAAHNADLRLQLIDLHTFLTYEKQIRGLQLQESRLSRRADQATTELQRLQTERNERAQAERRQQQQERQQQLEAAAQIYEAAQKSNQTFDPQENGFEFSNDEIEQYLAKRQAARDRFSATLGLPMSGLNMSSRHMSSAAA